ncbi:MAG: D-glycero-beta-D-manno-heptose 1-phosphate adenylyltransferase, partial [Planctomycetota bacterium]
CLMRELGIVTDGLVADPSRPTTVKTRFVSQTHQVLRVDDESLLEPGEEAVRKILAFLDDRLGSFDVLILSDYGKGVLSSELIGAAIARARANGIIVLVDPKGSDYNRYRGANVITPNKSEAESASGIRIEGESDLDRVAQRLSHEVDIESIVITLGKDGIYYCSRDDSQSAKGCILPTEARAVFDVTGAGDTVVALLGLSLAAGASLTQAVRLANLAAGIVVARFGTSTVTPDELRGLLRLPASGKILDMSSLAQVLANLQGRRIVFTNGCFDLLHPGHVDYLNNARAYGEVLIVGVNTDDSIRRLKGPSRPVCPLPDRLEVLAAFQVVDYVVPFEEDTPLELIQRINPSVLVKGEDWRDKGVVGRAWVEANGGQVVLIPLREGHSSSKLIERIRAAR